MQHGPREADPLPPLTGRPEKQSGYRNSRVGGQNSAPKAQTVSPKCAKFVRQRGLKTRSATGASPRSKFQATLLDASTFEPYSGLTDFSVRDS